MRNATARRIEILHSLICRRKEQAQQLAKEHNVSINTIYRDIDLLSTYFPIYTTKGRGGGVCMLEGYSFRRIYLTKEQELFLVKLKQSLTGQNLKILESILERFSKSYAYKNGRIKCAQ